MKIKTIKKKVKLPVRTKPQKGSQAVRVKYDKKAWLLLLDQATKHPLSQRVAAELYRGGVTYDHFCNAGFEVERSTFCRNVAEHLDQFSSGKGINPGLVPPCVPTFLKQAKPEKQHTKQRPTPQQALAAFKKWHERCVAEGWTDDDFFDALGAYDRATGTVTIRRVTDDGVGEEIPDVPHESEPQEDEAPKPPKTVSVKVPEYVTYIKGRIRHFPTLALLQQEMDKAAIKSGSPSGRVCSHCGMALGELVIELRTTQAAPECLHHGCYLLHYARRFNHPITAGQQALDPKTGKFFHWTAPPNKPFDWIEVAPSKPETVPAEPST